MRKACSARSTHVGYGSDIPRPLLRVILRWALADLPAAAAAVA